jgi:dihydroxy-acid dehydratase
LVTDGRFSGGTRGLCVGHVSPEAAAGGPLAALKNRDTLHIDAARRTLDVQLAPETLAARMEKLPPFQPKVQRGWLARYLQFVTSADKGAVFTI